jgi:hypothetical protein
MQQREAYFNSIGEIFGLEPYHYLHHVSKELLRAETVDQIEQLLPWRVDRETLQQYCLGKIDAGK